MTGLQHNTYLLAQYTPLPESGPHLQPPADWALAGSHLAARCLAASQAAKVSLTQTRSDCNCPAGNCLCRSNHKSVLGIGGYVRARGAVLSCVDEQGMEDWLNSSSDEHQADTAAAVDTAKARGKQYLPARLGFTQRQPAAQHSSTTSVTAAVDSQQPEGSSKEGKTLAEQALSRIGSRRGLGKVSAGAAAAGQQRDVTFSLVAYPSKDNYEGRLYPLDWINKVCLGLGPNLPDVGGSGVLCPFLSSWVSLMTFVTV